MSRSDLAGGVRVGYGGFRGIPPMSKPSPSPQRPPRRSATSKAATRKAAYHHGDLRRALIEAARAILEQDGLPALSLRAVARRAGVSQAAPYHHFPDRDA